MYQVENCGRFLDCLSVVFVCRFYFEFHFKSNQIKSILKSNSYNKREAYCVCVCLSGQLLTSLNVYLLLLKINILINLLHSPDKLLICKINLCFLSTQSTNNTIYIIYYLRCDTSYDIFWEKQHSLKI